MPFRLLWGFLAREGMREGEALALSWADLDPERGAVRLDKNKTDDPRACALDPHVAMALAIYRKTRRKDEEATETVFVDERGQKLSKFGLAQIVRDHLDQ